MGLNIQVFLLISRYCSDADKIRLSSILQEIADSYQALCDMNKQKAAACFWDEKQKKRCISEFRKAETLRKRVLQNLAIFRKLEKN